MPTAKPRITITLHPGRYRLLNRLAEQQGQSMAAIVVDLLETVAPVLERVSVAIENAERAKGSVRENLARVAEETEAALQPHVDAVMGQIDMFVGQSKAPAAEGSTPVAVTTGVRSGKESRSGQSPGVGVPQKRSKAGVKGTETRSHPAQPGGDGLGLSLSEQSSRAGDATAPLGAPGLTQKRVKPRVAQKRPMRPSGKGK